MGDTGSMLLGLLLAYAPISSLASLDPNTLTSPSAYSGGTVNRFPEILPLLVPATIMLIPYVDLLLAVVRRTRAGQSPFAGGQEAPAAPAAGHRALAPDQRADHVPVGDPVRRHRRAAVDHPHQAAGAGRRHAGRVPGPALADHAAAAAVGPAQRIPADASRGQPGARGRARQPGAGRAGRRGGRAGWAGACWPATGYGQPGSYRRASHRHTRLVGATDHQTVAAAAGRAEWPGRAFAAGLSGRARVEPGPASTVPEPGPGPATRARPAGQRQPSTASTSATPSTAGRTRTARRPAGQRLGDNGRRRLRQPGRLRRLGWTTRGLGYDGRPADTVTPARPADSHGGTARRTRLRRTRPATALAELASRHSGRLPRNGLGDGYPAGAAAGRLPGGR